MSGIRNAARLDMSRSASWRAEIRGGSSRSGPRARSVVIVASWSGSTWGILKVKKHLHVSF
jgi:hypothetical protein